MIVWFYACSFFLAALSAPRGPSVSSRCSGRACNPRMGNLAVGRRITTQSVCGTNSSDAFCFFKQTFSTRNGKDFCARPKCGKCNAAIPAVAHPPSAMSDCSFRFPHTWWQSAEGAQGETLQLDLETKFVFTHLILVFRSPRPAGMMLERSQDHGRTWTVLKYYAKNCEEVFGVREGQSSGRNGTTCSSKYSGAFPCTRGEVIYRALSPGSALDPYGPDALEQLTVTNLRVRLLQRQPCPCEARHSTELPTKHYAIYDFIVKGSCLCHGHADHCVPAGSHHRRANNMAPLSHLALGLMGEGRMWSPKSGWADAKFVLEAHGLKPISLKPKEGLALINGTQMITSLGAEAVERAQAIAQQADIVAALTLEVLKGTTKAFDSDIHALRPHPGQIEVAARFRSLLDSDHHPSEIAESHRFCDHVQDAYTMRCCPQVHGVVNDTINFAKNIINTEINSATDNPMVFAERGETISGGNFHGEYPAKALDFLAIAVHELASISERRTERLCNPSLSELPAFLVNEGGLNSGFMIAHCTAAALVSENKVLCHPSSVDSLSTSAATEDHVSMGGWAARKALRVIEHVEQVLAIELLAACQGIEFLRPLRTTTPLEKVYDLVRSVVKPWIKDRFMSPDIEAVHRLLIDQKVWQVAKPYIDKYATEFIPESRPVSPTAFSLEPPTSPRKRVRLE